MQHHPQTVPNEYFTFKVFIPNTLPKSGPKQNRMNTLRKTTGEGGTYRTPFFHSSYEIRGRVTNASRVLT
jgi:hypothetical protein